jgi:DNA-binding XRE family transcriptional regulator
MANIGIVLRDEITRLSRKECRRQLDSTRKASAQYRRDIAVLKSQVVQLERQVKLLARRALGALSTPEPQSSGTRPRFTAKGVRAQRARLALSAGDFGKLVGVSAQSIYNWESEKSRPRAEQLSKVAQLRSIGKREAEARLRNVA